MPDLSKLLAALDDHLTTLSDTAGTEIDEPLIRIANGQLLPDLPNSAFSPQQRQHLILKIYSTLPHIGPDATLIRLLKQVLEPVPLSALLGIEPPLDLTAGLDVNATDYHDICLSLLEKADTESAQKLATLQRDVYASLVRLWLCTPNEGTGLQAARVLANLIIVGKETVLKRLFRDKDIYELILSLCTFKSDKFAILSKPQTTIAQSRLLKLLPIIARLEWRVIVASHHPEIEAQYGLEAGQGLLDFAALKMVDYEEDLLMYQQLIGFYTSLLHSQVDILGSSQPSKALGYLISTKIHQNTMKLFHTLNDSNVSFDTKLVQMEIASYVSIYALTNDKVFVAKDAKAVIKTVQVALSGFRKIDYYDETPKFLAMFKVLSTIPQATLIDSGFEIQDVSIEFDSVTPLLVLSSIFKGPSNKIPTFNPLGSATQESPPVDTDITMRDDDDAEAAEELLRHYETKYPSFWEQLCKHAQDFTKPAISNAAQNMLLQIINAEWDGFSYIYANEVALNAIMRLLANPPDLVKAVPVEMLQSLKMRLQLAKALFGKLDQQHPNTENWVILKRRIDQNVIFRRGGDTGLLSG
jgi:hypothetical protein